MGADAQRPAAHSPGGLRFGAWLAVARRVAQRLPRDHAPLVSAGVALYSFLSVFPGLTAVLSIYALLAGRGGLEHHHRAFMAVLPPGVWDLFLSEMQLTLGYAPMALSTTAAISVLISLYSARAAMFSLMTATNIAYNERERRSFLHKLLLSIGFTSGAIAGFLLMLLLSVGLPVLLRSLGVSVSLRLALEVARLLLLWCAAAAALAVVYRYAPARHRAHWRWVSWGSALAATAWIAASALFGLYVRSVGAAGRGYGALGGMVALVLWFYISSFIVVLGAEINAELERAGGEDARPPAPAPQPSP